MSQRQYVWSGNSADLATQAASDFWSNSHIPRAILRGEWGVSFVPSGTAGAAVGEPAKVGTLLHASSIPSGGWLHFRVVGVSIVDAGTGVSKVEVRSDSGLHVTSSEFTHKRGRAIDIAFDAQELSLTIERGYESIAGPQAVVGTSWAKAGDGAGGVLNFGSNGTSEHINGLVSMPYFRSESDDVPPPPPGNTMIQGAGNTMIQGSGNTMVET